MENTINYCCTSSFIFCNFRFWKIGNIPVLDWYIYLQLNLVLTPVSTNLLTRLLWFEAIPASWVYTMYWPYTNFNTGFIPASCHAKISRWPCIRIMLVWKFFKRTQYPWSSYMKILNIPNTRMELVCSDSVPDQYCNIQVPSRSIVECSSFLQWLSSYIMHASNFVWSFYHLVTKMIKCDTYKGFSLWKKCIKVAKFWELFFWNCHI